MPKCCLTNNDLVLYMTTTLKHHNSKTVVTTLNPNRIGIGPWQNSGKMINPFTFS